jgi:hypothetical protein
MPFQANAKNHAPHMVFRSEDGIFITEILMVHHSWSQLSYFLEKQKYKYGKRSRFAVGLT